MTGKEYETGRGEVRFRDSKRKEPVQERVKRQERIGNISFLRMRRGRRERREK